MDADPHRQRRRGNALPLLNAAIEAMNLAKEVSSVTPAKAVFGSVSAILAMIRVRFLLFYDGELRVHVVTRIPWPTKLIMSTSGYPAPMCVEPSTGG